MVVFFFRAMREKTFSQNRCMLQWREAVLHGMMDFFVVVNVQVEINHLLHKLRCYTRISGPEKRRNNTREKICYLW